VIEACIIASVMSLIEEVYATLLSEITPAEQ
jgi:hypothetical protein